MVGTLIELMRRLDLPLHRYKIGAGWFAEKVTRLKLNGRLTGLPLSTIIDLETLRLGVEGKARVWQVLRDLAEHDTRLDGRRLDSLMMRARTQVDLLEDLRVRAAEKVFAGRTRTRRRIHTDHAYDDVLRARGDTRHASDR
jgi:hypothetical protein